MLDICSRPQRSTLTALIFTSKSIFPSDCPTRRVHISMSAFFGKVFAIRRIRPPTPRPTITTPSSINTQEPGFPSSARTLNTDPSNNDTRNDHMREYGILALSMTAPIAGSIPIVGSPLKSIVGALLEILKAADVSLRCVTCRPSDNEKKIIAS